ncbi:MAG: LytTR family DNA-binding domain-containing protein [Bacteroidota bacterium]
MEKFNCIIVDDDDIDRLTAVSYAKKFSELHIAGVFASTDEALKVVETQKIDILFLDIDMPTGSGLDFRKQLLHIPVCIFITAHPEHAVESFELDALDFMVKPLNLDRFTKTINRIKEFMELKHKAALFESGVGDDTIFIKEGHEQVKIKLHDILYLEALKDYTLIITTQKRHCVLSSIGTLLKEEHFKSFIRVHRSYAVHKAFIKKIGASEIELNNNLSIPIGRSYKDQLNVLLE